MRTYIITVLYFIRITDTTLVGQPNKLFSNTLPDNKSLKKSLGYIEDTYLNFTELATKYNYASEEHTVTTEDGYLLSVFRILPKCPQAQGFPVLLGHGINDSSDAWILTGPETGLGYILAINCYDVWAINYRGNVYSRKHLCLDPDKDPTFWEFSFNESGSYDLPAVIDYVLDVTRQSRVYYIGHSLGSTNFFAMGSSRPDYNEKIHLSIQLAPVAWLKNIRSPIPIFFAQKTNEIRTFLKYAGVYEIFGKNHITHVLPELICQIVPNEICGTVFALATGYRLESITSKNLAVAMGHLLVGNSLKNLAHLGQLIMSGEFQRYDEGESGNMRKYGLLKPPKYDVSLITSPVVLISAKNDFLSTIKDIDILSSRLPNLVENYVVPEPTWSHNNHLWGINATELIFGKILDYFQIFNT